MIVVMGVSGCGKTTVGGALAEKLRLPFFDADDFHPPANIEKMSSGTPLVDSDRYPWLKRLASEIRGWEEKGGAVLACSALKEEYREILSSVPNMTWVYLQADFDIILNRMKNRKHFMDPALLQSQFETLEVPSYGLHINAEKELDEIISEIINKLG
jgi:carbohydrate kinase (thermoresistant glucokinase family)